MTFGDSAQIRRISEGRVDGTIVSRSDVGIRVAADLVGDGVREGNARRQGAGPLITDAEIDAVSAYVANGMSGAGADVFAGTCSACHGEDGMGMEYVAPSVASFTPTLVANVLNHGKKGAIGTMPAFERLNAKQKEAVGAYITSLSK